jgi:hypothetical protein
MNKIIAVIVMVIMPMVAGCGGGGSSTTPTTAVLKLSSQGTLPDGKAVSGFGATIELPAGVTAKTATDGAVAATVVASSGLLAGSAGTMGPVTYTQATATAKAKLDFTIASTAAAGVGVGEYATITLTLSGVSPAVTDFNVTSFKPVDLSYADMTELTSKLTLTLY